MRNLQPESVSVENVDALNREQRARAEALRTAREIVRTQKPWNPMTSAQGGETVDIVDVLSVAQFILTGEDPWPTTTHESDIVEKPAGWEIVEAAIECDGGCKCDPDALGAE